jgi:hypothetical protein
VAWEKNDSSVRMGCIDKYAGIKRGTQEVPKKPQKKKEWHQGVGFFNLRFFLMEQF